MWIPGIPKQSTTPFRWSFVNGSLTSYSTIDMYVTLRKTFLFLLYSPTSRVPRLCPGFSEGAMSLSPCYTITASEFIFSIGFSLKSWRNDPRYVAMRAAELFVISVDSLMCLQIIYGCTFVVTVVAAWFLWWVFKWSACELLYAHWEQLNGFSPVCILKCLLK